MQNSTSFFLSLLYRDFLKFCTDELKKSGLSYGQLPFILYVGKHPACPQSELTKRLHLDWGHCQRSVAKLVETGFMTKEYQNSCNCLHLTDLGEQAFQQIYDLFPAWDQAHLDILSPEEQVQLNTLLRRLSANVLKEVHHESL